MTSISWLSQSSYIKGNKEVFDLIIESLKKDFSDSEIVFWYEDKMKIETARQIMESLNTKPNKEKRFAVIGFNILGLDAQNAMLKTLEEPSCDTSIIFVTSLPEKLIRTVRSRMIERSFDFEIKKESKKNAENIGEALKQVEKILRDMKKDGNNESAKAFITNLMIEEKNIEIKSKLLKLFSYLDDSSASSKQILETAVALSF